jgi:hypothetical protein
MDIWMDMNCRHALRAWNDSTLTFNTGRVGGDVQIRAILAASWGKDLPAGHAQFAVQLTDMGSETSHARIGGLLRVDESVAPSDQRSDTWADRSLQPPFVESPLQDRVLARAGTFLRLVLCYYPTGCGFRSFARRRVASDIREPVMGWIIMQNDGYGNVWLCALIKNANVNDVTRSWCVALVMELRVLR